MLQETMENLLHPPAVVSILVLGLVFLLAPQQYKNFLLSDFIDDTIPMFASFRAYVLHPLARILLGWEINDNYSQEDDTSFNNSSFSSGHGVKYLLDEHRNATSIIDRSKITSRAMMMSLQNQLDASGASSTTFNKESLPPTLHVVRGLVNTGNSCFLNSVLQALSALSSLQPYLESLLTRADDLKLPIEDSQVAEALLETIETLQEPQSTHKSFRPRTFVSALEAARSRDPKASGYSSNIMNRDQQDAQELFQIVSSALSAEELNIQKLQAVRPLMDVDLLESLVKLDTKPQNMEKLSNPMAGMLASRLSCVQCGYTEAIRHFAFDNLSLSIPSTYSCSIEDCLQQFVNLESLSDVVCRKCSLLGTLDHLQEDVKRLDSSPSKNMSNATTTNTVRRRKKPSKAPVKQHYSSDSESDLNLDYDRIQRPVTYTKAERAAVKAKLVQRQHSLIAAIRSDVQAPLPDVTLVKVVSPHCTKQVMIGKAPPVLCLHFQRSQYSPYGTVSKNNCRINFPEYLDLSPFCTSGVLLTRPNVPMSVSEKALASMGYQPSATPNRKTMYKLQSVVVHYGGHSYGHFIAYRRKPASMVSKVDPSQRVPPSQRTSRAGMFMGSQAEDWFRISDETVESVTLGDVLGANPYMCLYEKVEEEVSEKSMLPRALSSLSLQAVELGLGKLLRLAKRRTESVEPDVETDTSSAKDSGVDMSMISEKEYATFFSETLSALSKTGVKERDEDMSDMEHLQQEDGHPWKSFVSSPNSTTPPSPIMGSYA
ncbi:hypothetical protein BGZ93_008528 [Podila epicladia]|nr:hypothetical protein BGZ92_002531 [Podila epicladia]KAG0092016.1 hypothetical protein BGZ93_008528 [Podila epicladia]